MHRTLHVGAVLVVVSLIAACQQAPRSVVGPSAMGGAALHADSSTEDRFGSLEHGNSSAATDSGFECALGPGYGVTEDTHATISNSGNETVVCSGNTPFPPARAELLEGFPCELRFGDGDTTDSRRVITPSGQITLVCKG